VERGAKDRLLLSTIINNLPLDASLLAFTIIPIPFVIRFAHHSGNPVTDIKSLHRAICSFHSAFSDFGQHDIAEVRCIGAEGWSEAIARSYDEQRESPKGLG